MSIHTKLTAALVGLLGFLLILVGLLFFLVIHTQVKKDALSDLEKSAEFIEEQLLNMYSRNMERLQSISSRKALITNLAGYLENRIPKGDREILSILKNIQKMIPEFQSISILDNTGKTVVSTDAQLKTFSHTEEKYFIKGLHEKYFYMGINNQGEERLYLSGPLFENNERLGAVVITLLPTAALKIASDYTGLGSTGDILLAQKEGGENVRFLAPVRFSDAGFGKYIPLDRSSVSLLTALDAKETYITNATDYRGQAILAVTRYLPETGWAIVVKRDKEEIFMGLHRLFLQISAVGFFVMALGWILAYYLSRSLTDPIVRLVEGTNIVGKGDLEYRIPVEGNDEIGDLARSFNDMISNLRSTTSSRNHYDALAKKHKRLHKIKNRFIGIVSHDIRNPVTILKGQIRLFLDGFLGTLTETQTTHLKKMERAAENMLYFADSLLDLHQIETGQLSIHREEMSLLDFLKDCQESYKGLAEAKNIQLLLEIGQFSVPVRMDPNRMRQAVANLITNAIKFSLPSTSVILRGRVENGQVFIEVEDHGEGIAEEDIGKLFKPFARLGTKSTAGEKMTGLGLSIVKKIVESHGGKIEVCSKPKEGSTFSVNIPI